MGKLSLSLSAIAACALLAACGSEAATAPPPSPTLSASPISPPSTSASPTPPVMPSAAQAQTRAGAEAFVRFYVSAIDYAERTLDTSQLKTISAPSCVGCHGGIKGIDRIAQLGGHVEGVAQSATSATTTAFDMVHRTAAVSFAIDIATERVVVPGQKAVIHPAGRTLMLGILIARPGGSWQMADLRTRP